MMIRPIRLTHDSDLVIARSMCPFCASPFHPGDSVIQCPSCKTPHHSACWQQIGNRCSTLGCIGEGEIALDALSPIDLIQIFDSEIPQESPEVEFKRDDEPLRITVPDTAAPNVLVRVLPSEELPDELSRVEALERKTNTLRGVILLSVGLIIALAAVGIFLQIRVNPLPIEPNSFIWIGIYLILGFLGGAVLGAIIGHANASRAPD